MRRGRETRRQVPELAWAGRPGHRPSAVTRVSPVLPVSRATGTGPRRVRRPPRPMSDSRRAAAKTLAGTRTVAKRYETRAGRALVAGRPSAVSIRSARCNDDAPDVEMGPRPALDTGPSVRCRWYGLAVRRRRDAFHAAASIPRPLFDPDAPLIGKAALVTSHRRDIRRDIRRDCWCDCWCDCRCDDQRLESVVSPIPRGLAPRLICPHLGGVERRHGKFLDRHRGIAARESGA